MLRDEVFSALTAHSIVDNGHDLNGRFLPLFFQMQMRFGSQMWFQPLLMYAIALSIQVLPFSEGTIRLPMALAGVVDVVLMYFVGKQLFRSELPAAAAAILLALTPAHFIHSRVAMDFQAPLPFILAWLLCLLLYLRRNDRWLLFAAGLALGVGLYSYIVAYMLMPIYALLTSVLLYQRREPLNRYGILAAGLVLPALVCVPFVWTHPTVIRDIFWHYKRDEPQTLGAFGLLRAFVTYQRFVDAASLYSSFWNPRFLFVNGPRAMWAVGVFLLPAAGLLLVGVVRALSGPAAYAVLLIGGLLSAPIAASLVDEPEAIRRAVAILPFAVLLAIGGLDYLRTAETTRGGRIAFVAVWATSIVLAATYHDLLPRAQALLRASTVPVAVTGLAVLMRHFSIERAKYRQAAVVAFVALVATHLAYVAVDYSTTVGVWLLAAIGLATLLPPTRDRFTRNPLLVVALLAVACSHFIFVYVGSANVHRVAFVPASVVLLTVRLVFAALALIAVLGVAILVEHVTRDRPGSRWLAAASLLMLIGCQLAYFYIDHFTDYRMRFLQSTAVLAAVVGVAMLQKGAAIGRAALGQIAFAGMLAVASIQFTYFYADYFTAFRVFGSGESEGNVRIAWDAAVERAGDRPVPAVYLGKIGPYGFGDLFWTFNVIRDNRQDILARTIPDLEFKPDRIRSLPTGSIVITSRSTEIDQAIDRMEAVGELERRELLNAPDGTPVYWILERGAR